MTAPLAGPAIIYGMDGADHLTSSNDPGYVWGGGGSGNDHLYGFDPKGGVAAPATTSCAAARAAT